MKYQWEEWTLDMDARVLMRDGRPFSVSRRVLQCISHLIAHRERVVEYDELIRKVWGHDNVTNNQLSQVILSARRVFGDDGQAQRLIVTVPGVGYRWAGQVEEVSQVAAAMHGPLPSQPQAAAAEAPVDMSTRPVSRVGEADPKGAQAALAPGLSVGSVDVISRRAITSASRSRGGRTLLAFCALLLLSVPAIVLQLPGRPSTSASSSQTTPDPLKALDDAMHKGEFDKVRDGLAALPTSKADSPDAMLIAMRLDMNRGLYERAQQKLEQQLVLATAAADPIWQAKLLVFECLLKGRFGNTTTTSRLESLQAAIDLLEPLGEDAAPQTLAEALRHRANTYDDMGKYEETMRDFARSEEIYEGIGDTRGVFTVRSDRTRIWMRYGRLEDALRLMPSLVDYHLRTENNTRAIVMLSDMSRTQMELLRTQQALETSQHALALVQEIPQSDLRQGALLTHALVLARLGRLREARVYLEDLDPRETSKWDNTVRALHLLESGDDDATLKASTEAFVNSNWEDTGDILLTTREGALLIWTIAASRLVKAGKPTSTPSPMQLDALRNPKTIPGIIASAQWEAINNDDARAEAMLREALDNSRHKGLRYHMILATEPLFDLLLAQGRNAEAKRLLEEIRAFDRDRMDDDFHFMRMRWVLADATSDTNVASSIAAKLRGLAGERPISALPNTGKTQNAQPLASSAPTPDHSP